MKLISKNITQSEQVREFLDGSERRSVVLKTAAMGLGVYQPGWRWSLHAGAQTGKPSARHIGYIVSGQMIIQDADGLEILLKTGDAFEVEPGHDAWVFGDEVCFAL
ncbi:MAG: hypothetical protein OEZ58_21660, partial [Gammaproteobacteria bacterium]|nr:hypothetical protein [Gammaproteobacteria bacterium]